jgi:hypothetical protein
VERRLQLRRYISATQPLAERYVTGRLEYELRGLKIVKPSFFEISTCQMLSDILESLEIDVEKSIFGKRPPNVKRSLVGGRYDCNSFEFPLFTNPIDKPTQHPVYTFVTTRKFDLATHWQIIGLPSFERD